MSYFWSHKLVHAEVLASSEEWRRIWLIYDTQNGIIIADLVKMLAKNRGHGSDETDVRCPSNSKIIFFVHNWWLRNKRFLYIYGGSLESSVWYKVELFSDWKPAFLQSGVLVSLSAAGENIEIISLFYNLILNVAEENLGNVTLPLVQAELILGARRKFWKMYLFYAVLSAPPIGEGYRHQPT